MSRKYWFLFWGGLAFFVFWAIVVMDIIFDVRGTAESIMALVGFGIWALFIVVGVLLSDNPQRHFTFWWSIAAFTQLFIAGVIAMEGIDAPTYMRTFIGLASLVIWLFGGIAVLVIGIVRIATGRNEGQAPPTAGIAAPAGRSCPYCAETIKVEAIKCRFCGSELPAVTE